MAGSSDAPGWLTPLELGDEAVAGLPALLSAWAPCKTDDAQLADSVRAWQQHLRGGSPFWQLAGNEVAQTLQRALNTIAELSRALEEFRSGAIDDQLNAWLTYARALRSYWPIGDRDGWEALFCSRGSHDNPLFTQAVGRALSAGLDRSRLPKLLAAPLIPLLRHAAGEADFPLPPASSYPNDVAAYLIPGQTAAVRDACRGLLDDCCKLLEQVQAFVVARERAAGTNLDLARAKQSVWQARFAIEKQQELVDAAIGGWPVQAGQWHVRLSALDQALAEVASTSVGRTSGFGETICKLRGDLERLNQRTAVGRVENHAQTGLPGETQLEDTWPEPKSQFLNDESPSAAMPDRPIEQSEGSESTASSPDQTLAELIQALVSCGDENARQFAARLSRRTQRTQ